MAGLDAYTAGGRQVKWTREEDEILRDNYFDCTWDELYQLVPGRTHNAIRKRATQRLGLARNPEFNMTHGRDEWTPDETHCLIELYPEAPREQILAALPGRTWKAIVKRAFKLGVKRDKRLASVRAANPYIDGLRLEAERKVMDYLIDYYRQWGAGPMREEIKHATGVKDRPLANALTRLEGKRLVVFPRVGRRLPVYLAPALRRRIDVREREMTAA